MPQSPIRKLVPFAENAKKKGTKVYHLNIGQPDIKTPQVALDAVKNSNLEVLAYARSEGSEEYRNKLANYYVKNNIPVNSSNIVVTTGGSEALLFTIGSITDPDDAIIIPEPFYANYNGFSPASGVKVVIDIVKTGADKIEKYVSYELEDCLVSSYSVSAGDAAPSEGISISFAKLTMSYTAADRKNAGATPERVGYDLEKGVKL